MKRYLVHILLLLATATTAVAQQPMYIVNGAEQPEIKSIPPNDIELIETLPADELTIARYGERAAHGVLLITLRYDQQAHFKSDTTFAAYIAEQVKWDSQQHAARVVLRYTITPEGETRITETLESTDSRLKRRILKAVAEAPRWSPARKANTPIESEGVLNLQLPEGKPMPRLVEIVYR